MPMLDNQRHELFAQALAAGKSADEAYQAAGYSPNRGNASTLKANQNITARVAELQSRQAQGVVITRQRVLEEMAALGFGSVSESLPASVKRAALRDIAQMQGWMIEKAEIGQPGDFDRLAPDELRSRLTEEAKVLGLVPPVSRETAH